MKIYLPGIVFYSIILLSCSSPEKLQYWKISGFTQGTSYHITYGVNDSIDFQPSIDSLLRDFDLSLSAWEPASVLSKLNRNETNTVDEKFARVYEVALEVYKQSDGAFDLTVMPLVNAWGFGPDRKLQIDSLVIDSLLQLVGMDKIKLEGAKLIKTNPNTSIDVNAIAQGYSVDLVALFLEEKGCLNYMVEIGGEVRTKGRNPKNAIWRIGIDRPDFGNNISGLNLQAIVELDQKSLATSGNYRKYYEEDGEKFTHSIDPKTGYPAKQQILSVTVITNECIYADAIATAVMVMGLEAGKQMISQLQGVDAYMIYADQAGEYSVFSTPGFEKILSEK